METTITERVTIGEAVRSLCNYWNEFASRPNRKTFLYRLPLEFRTNAAIREHDTTLKKIAAWILRESEWQTLFEECLTLAEKNRFLKGLSSNFVMTLSWLFTERDGEPNLMRIINGKYAASQE